MKVKEISISIVPLDETLNKEQDYQIVDHFNLTGSSPKGIGFIPITELYLNKEEAKATDREELMVVALREGEVPNEEEKAVLLKQGFKAYSYELIPQALELAAEGYRLNARAYIPEPPSGFSLESDASGVKTYSNLPETEEDKKKILDLGIIRSSTPCMWAGVFTKNGVKASCVTNNQKLIGKKVSALIVNSGNANCATGKEGHEHDLLMRSEMKTKFNLGNEVLTASTGVIGRKLPIEKITNSISNIASINDSRANNNESKKSSEEVFESVNNFSKAILTTDLVTKFTQDENKNMLGIAKGSGMIAPNMATMLAFIITDKKIKGLNEAETERFMQSELKRITNETFNNISVDGDTSTNDMLLLLNNQLGETISKEEFSESLVEVCESLCYKIIADGEGFSKIIDLKLKQLPISANNLQRIGKNIINSMLVKTAIFGSDPNWGRIIAAFARDEELLEGFEAESAELKILDMKIFSQGEDLLSESELSELSQKMKKSKHIEIEISLPERNSGDAELCSASFLGNDLSYDYVKINAEYTT
ncbi:MAG: bifunctional ornithine acetyltransferase/N-acetylglutamate synthase [Candidatus Caenarcaniphilales bacterium]|nr:bifunctional ornithine acetyltransferase/N-acetylglutamate synthase [Candidatus Caenarcaniphilales bacterium]